MNPDDTPEHYRRGDLQFDVMDIGPRSSWNDKGNGCRYSILTALSQK